MTNVNLDANWTRVRDAHDANKKIEADLLTRFPIDKRTLPEILKAQAARFGDRVLFRCGTEQLTFAGALEVARLWAGLLYDQGIRKGDRVAILCGNRLEFMQLFLGCAWLGAVSVPVNTASRGMQLQHILQNSGARLLCAEASLMNALEMVDIAVTALEKAIVIGGEASQVADLEVVPLPSPGEPAELDTMGPGDLLTIIYTSGTTGLSKGVRCPHGQYFWWGVYTARQVAIRDGDVLHTTLPLFHTNALNCFFQALLMGATQVAEDRFSVSKFWDRLIESGATITYVLGAMVPMLLSRAPQSQEVAHNVRAALAPGVPGHLNTTFTERTGIILFDGYGATESNAVIGTDVHCYRPGTMGKVQQGFEARVVDGFDQTVPDGTPGELVLRATEPFSMSDGYFEMAEKTAESWRNLWLHTGDSVIRDSEGYFTFVDRMKDAIRRRGENISSYEVEQVLTSYPAIGVAAVFAVASDLAEDEVMAVVALAEGQSLDKAELVQFCAKRMPYFAVPRFIDVVDDLPRTENGKVQKFKLRERGRTESTWDREAEGIEVAR